MAEVEGDGLIVALFRYQTRGAGPCRVTERFYAIYNLYLFRFKVYPKLMQDSKTF